MEYLEIKKQEEDPKAKQYYIPPQNVDYIKRMEGGYATIVLKSGKEIKTKHLATFIMRKLEEMNKNQTILEV